jgi:hypothetical protein
MRTLQTLDTVGNVGTVLVVHHTGMSTMPSCWLFLIHYMLSV